MTRNIHYTSRFKRLYKKLDIHLQSKTKQALLELQQNPFPQKLRVHQLSGKLYPYYSCRIDYKNRIIFEIGENGKIILLLVGDHSIYNV